jgi:uncharacterized RDD family membrane protein YckC
MSDSTQNPPPEGNQAPPPPPAGGTPPPEAPGPYAQQPAPPPPPPPMGQPGYGPGYGAPPSKAGQPADLLIRFLARFIDGILVSIVSWIITRIIVGGIMGEPNSALGVTDSYAANAVSAIISALLYLGYFTIMEARTGQTLGKMLLKLRTQGPDGGLPTTEQALRRNAWSGLGILGIVPFLGVIAGLAQRVIVIGIAVTIHNSPSKQGWHDTFARGTQVVRTG